MTSTTVNAGNAVDADTKVDAGQSAAVWPVRNSPELSVIIPAINEQLELPALLAQLSEQTGVALEILVADGGSTDD